MTETTAETAADEHFAEAQRYAALAAECEGDPAGKWDRSVHLQAAQVHATLAQTAVARSYAATLAAFIASLEPPADGGGESILPCSHEEGSTP
jgi:hypothetical protein